MHGFTCGLDDVLLSPAAEAKRASTLLGVEAAALRASATAAGLPPLQVRLTVNPSSKVLTICPISKHDSNYRHISFAAALHPGLRQSPSMTAPP